VLAFDSEFVQKDATKPTIAGVEASMRGIQIARLQLIQRCVTDFNVSMRGIQIARLQLIQRCVTEFMANGMPLGCPLSYYWYQY
jgi:hypothetical protein